MDRSLLAKPFDHILHRQGAAGRTFDYVPAGDVIQRVIDATESFEWEVLRIDYQPATATERTNKRTGEVYTAVRAGYWLVHGRLTIPGLGSRDGIGTQIEENEDSPKGAETDAFKRAAVKFGVALGLYRNGEEGDQAPDRGPRTTRRQPTPAAAASTRSAAPARPSAPCPECKTTGPHHRPGCAYAAAQVAA